MLPEPSGYPDDVAEATLREGVWEYMDDVMLPKLVPALEKVLRKELADRQESVRKLEAIIEQLFPEEPRGSSEQGGAQATQET